MTKLNLGCKRRTLSGFDNLDKIYGWLFQDGLPQYAEGSVDGITISHALMFLTVSELEKFTTEMWRVLRIGGVVRITEDDTENPLSDTYQTGCITSNPSCLTGPKMMRTMLEGAGFKVYDVDRTTTYFVDSSLLQAYRGGPPKRYFIEGVKGSVLQEGIKQSGRPFEIPNCSRDDLPQFFVELGYKVGAEIGVYKGAFTEKFCRAGLKMYAIDPWMAFPGQGRTQMIQERQDFLYGHTQRTLTPYKDCTIIRATSMEALKDFKDESLDFVYIDGDHRFRYIAEDIYEWYLKIKKGGIISGDDYFCTGPGANNVLCHVKPIVDAFALTYDIPNFYVIGQKDKKPSWIIIKE